MRYLGMLLYCIYEGTPLKIEALVSLIGEDSFTTFSQELLDGKAGLSLLQLTQITKEYLNI